MHIHADAILFMYASACTYTITIYMYRTHTNIHAHTQGHKYISHYLTILKFGYTHHTQIVRGENQSILVAPPSTLYDYHESQF